MTFATRLACFIHYDLGRAHIVALLAYIASAFWLGHRLAQGGNR